MTTIKIPAKLILQKLIKEGKLPKSAKKYTQDIVYSALNGRITDEQVMTAYEEIKSTFA